ncbi:L-rhamnose mutarotase [Antarcticibacterium sp. 1MA-6-2]|uniref:L-rhamnose mutarotase n=1 Tax=Antarcticibacterium sp. 1MA-6-2 TaxID=2908210 RepID=UPI001F18B964|nr:L-rhamnose mutarotase [Antarcticibacterium sp. 1MA-6-2]UJH90713.1 L-rhamnose mutarotase [Antarcticibacterium sp. 1MA-6-2]
MKKYVLACDLKDDDELKKEYIEHHKKVWPEVLKSIRQSGIQNMEIFSVGNRLVMVIETTTDFSFEKKAEMDDKNFRVREWEELMWKYQERIPTSGAGEKWVLMDKIFSLNE